MLTIIKIIFRGPEPAVLSIADGAGLHQALVCKCFPAGLYRDVNGAVFASLLSRYACFAMAALRWPPNQKRRLMPSLVLTYVQLTKYLGLDQDYSVFCLFSSLFFLFFFSLSFPGLLKTALRNLRNGALSNEHDWYYSTVHSCDGPNYHPCSMIACSL